MKKINIVIAVVLVALCAVGWISIASQKASKAVTANKYIEDADSWVEKGLYQRAIGNYELALEEKPTEELYCKIDATYQLRYKEAPEETLSPYMEFLNRAVTAYPANEQLVDNFYYYYKIKGKYKEIYNCLSQAVKNGYDTDEVLKQLREVRYAYEIKRGGFSGIKQSDGKFYTMSRNNAWNLYDIEGGYLFSKEYEYMSVPSDEGVVVTDDNDSRIIDTNGMVLGIFENKITASGVFAEKMVAASTGDKYSYYNDFAEKQFGNYDVAGMFQDGLAAVCENGKWMLIDKTGEAKSQVFEEIVLDKMGRYIVNDLILAKVSDGTYKLYDKKWKEKATLECDDVDILTIDGLIAICQNGKWGYMNLEGEVVIQPQFSNARSFSNGLAAVFNGEKWGFIDKNGDLVVEYKFTDVGYMESTGACPVRMDTIGEGSESDENTDSEYVESWKLLELILGILED